MRMYWLCVGLFCGCDAAKTPSGHSSVDTESWESGSPDTGEVTECDPPRLDLMASWFGESLYGPLPEEWLSGLGSCGWGMAALDLDGDGDEDLLLAGAAAPTRPLLNGAGALSPGETVQFDGGLLPAGNGLTVGDFNGDGRPDVVLVRSKGEADLVFFNMGLGVFSSVALEESTDESQHATPFDADGDGDLDLYISRHMDIYDTNLNALEEGELRGAGNRLYLNDGSNLIPAPQDSTADSASFQAIPMDPDMDGDLDLYLVNDFGPFIRPNALLVNDGTGNFSPDPDCGCELAMFGMGASASDHNNDGYVDLHITNLGTPRLLMGLGDGSFVDATAASGALIQPSEDRVTSWGTSFVDIDQDGWDDVVTAFGPVLMGIDGDWTDVVDHPLVNDLDDSPQQRNAFFHNREGVFVEDSSSVGFDWYGSSRSLVVADFNEDGMPDVVVASVEPDLSQSIRMYVGSGGCGAGVTVGFPERRAGDIGAQVSWSVGGEERVRWYQPGTTFSASGSTIHLGLGGAAQADWVRITPRGGESIEHADVSAGTRLDQRSYQ